MSERDQRRLRDDFRATSDAIAQAASDLAGIEREKATLDPADPRVTELSSRAGELTRRMDRHIEIEDSLVRAATEPGRLRPN